MLTLLVCYSVTHVVDHDETLFRSSELERTIMSVESSHDSHGFSTSEELLREFPFYSAPGDLTDAELQSLQKQLKQWDMSSLQELHSRFCSTPGNSLERFSLSPLESFTAADSPENGSATQVGNQLLQEGKVAALLVAGGLGSRLGFDGPKGMFPYGPISNCTLFEWFAEQIQARSLQSGQAIPLLIMTSDETHFPTVDYFETHRFLGLSEEDVYFFQQGNLPVLDAETGRALLKSRSEIQTAPDGHGGMLQALGSSGLLEEMYRRGIEHLFYFQVDNPAVQICDPCFLGHHIRSAADISVKVVEKEYPEERMGVLVRNHKKIEVIEYSDLPIDLAVLQDHNGRLQYWAGNTAIHLLSCNFLEYLLSSKSALPLHTAHKAMSYQTSDGKTIHPDSPNAIKFERFIFDAFPESRNLQVVETKRDQEFLPIKNATGNDSPETCRKGMMKLHRNWLHNAGRSVASSVPVEIQPSFALDSTAFKNRMKDYGPIEEPHLFAE